MFLLWDLQIGMVILILDFGNHTGVSRATLAAPPYQKNEPYLKKLGILIRALETYGQTNRVKDSSIFLGAESEPK
jgi:hypothetical protein